MHKSSFVISLACCVVLSPVGASSSYLYTYTGNDFTNVTSLCCGDNTPFTTSDFIKFQFITPYALGANWNEMGFPPTAPTWWSLSVGPLEFGSADGESVIYSMNFSTNASAQITAWQFTTQTDVIAPDLLPWEYPPQPYVEEVFSANAPTFCCEDAIYIPRIFMDSDYASNSYNPGTWVIASIPESSTWSLMIAGFAALGYAGYRTTRKAVAVEG
jgi:hypothetical protein